ncbi:hypothetical protein CALVIDRAFT_542412 [Calocera viscosa TUFC12733]|uniref:DUF7918 domain-containing protein n=1 Tax=Calocera viscosa (strain TUFC12733) TaxID=1330018 RepID=A0A167GKW2_CALVF|nr:hypothetical protein CALVIDRAFT_542412 [Calocera viscosa TUFC12733]
MPRLGDYEAWVEVGGVRLEEYPMVESGTGEMVVRCWIASEEGKNFVVHLKDHKPGQRAIRGRISIDGRLAAGVIVRASSRSRTVPSSGFPITATQTKLYQFGKISLTEDEHLALQDENLIKQLGTIKMLCETGNAVPDNWISGFSPSEVKPVHEKSKKGASHWVVPGAEVQEHRIVYAFRPNGGRASTLVFHYAPKDLLQARGIMPRDTPVNEEEERAESEENHSNEPAVKVEDMEGENSEEARAAEARIRQLEEELAALRRDKDKGKRAADGLGTGRPTKRMKLEQIDTNRFFAAGEVIDLT